MTRHLPDFVTMAQPAAYEIEIKNRSDTTQKGLILFDALKDPRPDTDLFLNTTEPHEENRNAWDRKTLYHRWLWLIRKELKAFLSPVRLPDIGPNDTLMVKIEFTPHHRGILHFDTITLARPDIFGLFNRLHRIDRFQTLVVLPRRYPVKPPNLISTRQYHPGGIRMASAIGDSNEFMALRPYRPGDPLRNIHWRSFAKTNDLVIKEFEDEFFVRHALILDTCIGQQNELVFEHAVSAASSYIQVMQGQESILDLMFVGNRIYAFSSGRGISHADRMLEVMASVQPSSKDIEELLPAIQKNIQQLSGAICIFMDWTQAHQDIATVFDQARISAKIIVLTPDPDQLEQTFSTLGLSTPQFVAVHVDDLEKVLS